MLADRQPRGVEERRALLEFLSRSPASLRSCSERAERERGRGQVIGEGEEVIVRRIALDGPGAGAAGLRHARQLLAAPCAPLPGQHVEAAPDVVQLVQKEVVAGRVRARERYP